MIEVPLVVPACRSYRSGVVASGAGLGRRLGFKVLLLVCLSPVSGRVQAGCAAVSPSPSCSPVWFGTLGHTRMLV